MIPVRCLIKEKIRYQQAFSISFPVDAKDEASNVVSCCAKVHHAFGINNCHYKLLIRIIDLIGGPPLQRESNQQAT
jgi:hypothetical protein